MDQNEVQTYNSATKTRFILDMDLSPVLGNRNSVKNIRLNCYSASTPEVVSGVTYQGYQGYQIPIPNGNRSEEKILSIGFTVSENLVQYAAMLCWINKITKSLDVSTVVGTEDKIDVNLWILDSYLKPIPTPIKYTGVFIGRCGRLDFDQTDDSGDVLKCSAEFYYASSTMDYDKILV